MSGRKRRTVDQEHAELLSLADKLLDSAKDVHDGVHSRYPYTIGQTLVAIVRTQKLASSIKQCVGRLRRATLAG